ncbi:hypothetical protein DSM112329_04614 [Paraconexibacter sp. AEG42_29]|uniref:Circadian input-output histidine kinase CikA n=1 Tax=Paraconexibacter sp. AEG42_29 TaxID=2997339 RepID=A0AAU7B1C8_9ACTN
MRRRALSIRVLFGTLLTLVMALAGALFSVTILQRDTAADRTAAEHARVTSFGLSDQMRQSSNDLTRMVRLYVTTGDARYRRFYEEILAIRRGRAPRPVGYDSSFWDRVLADGGDRVTHGPPVSLPGLMRRARFAPGEFTALNASLRASDGLAQLERRVMDTVAARIVRGTGAGYLEAVAPQYRRLVDASYHVQKRRIMAAIERFTALVDARTTRRSEQLQTRTDHLLVAQSAILILLGLVVLVLLTLAVRMIARPLQRLTAVTRRITGGDWSGRAPADGVLELRRLAGDFNAMADAVQRDLAARRAAEEEARDAGRRLRTIADRVPGAVFQFHVDADDALSVRFASRDASVHGVAANQGVDFPAVARAVLADDRGAWLDSMVAAARSGDTWHHEYRIYTPTGEVAWMQAQAEARAWPNGSGDLYGYVADVTERKALEADLRQARADAEAADRAKSRFLAMMSHELRTPLVAVTGTLEILALRRLDDEQRDLVDVATRSARSLLAVIGDVLDFSKIEAGHLDLVVAPVALGALVDDLAAQYRQAAAGKGLSITTVRDPRLAAGHEADPVRLRQVLGNLVANAVKFTDVGGVTLRTEVVEGGSDARSQRVAICVTDTGVGITAADQAELFSPFTQAASGTTRRTDGTGLGLVISRQIVDAMGGEVSLSSAAGTGTTVRVELPLATTTPPGADDDQPVPQLARAVAGREEAARDGSLLLLVEDHPVNREIIQRQLRAMGFACDVAGDADAALALCGQTRYGLVLSDINLPGTDGYGLARALRDLEAGRGQGRTPLVALTASALRGERDRCRAAGMDDLVVKPATLATLAQTLQRWLPHLAWSRPAAGPGAGAPQGGLAVDSEVLDELTGGDPALREQITLRYLESLTTDLAALHTALDHGDVAGVRRHAHQIAGASRMVGAHEVAADAAGIELLAGDPDPDPHAVQTLAAELAEHASLTPMKGRN